MSGIEMKKRIKWFKSAKAKAVRVLGGFLMIALICTYLSRFASAAITPRVECDNASRGSVTHIEWSEKGEIISEEESQMYDLCLPWSAIRIGLNGTSYVLVADVKQTILGETLYAKRIGVKIKDSDDDICAVESSALTRDMQVIIESDKNIEAGDTIRFMEK